MDLAEQFAQAVLEQVLPHVRVSHVSDQAHGEHDFDLQFPNGDTACVEVASIVDDQQLETIAAIVSPKKGGTTIAARQSRGRWHVSLSDSADVRRVRQQLDAALAAVEACGLTTFDLRLDDLPMGLGAVLSGLRVTSGDVVDFVPAGEIWLGLPSSGGWVSPHYVNVAVTAVAARPDNIRKLSHPNCVKRHLFVYVDSSANEPFTALLIGGEVAAPPDLPQHISHVWVGAFLSSLCDARVWRAERGGQWVSLDLHFPTSKVFTSDGRRLGGDA